MNNLKKFVTLDLITIKPYLTDKRLLIYVFLAFILPYGNKDPLSAISLLLVFSMLITTYPFAISDQNNLDTLYLTLNISRKHVVIGRYFTILILYIGGATIGTGIYLILSIVMNQAIIWSQVFILIGCLLTFSIITQCLQVPFFFKNGYLKSKALAYLPLALISVLVLIGSQLYQNGFKESFDSFFLALSNNSLLTISLIILVIIMSVMTSYKLSLKYYSRKEL